MRRDYASYLEKIDLSKRILEIGPLTNPILSKREANVFYADIRSTEEVKKLHENDPGVCKENIRDIDFVIKDSYEKSLSHVEKFDYILSSHVVEHMPRLIEFFQDIATVLTANGLLYVFVPDHRYCFDHFRTPTSFAEAYYIHQQGIRVPPWRVFDHQLETIPLNDAGRFWFGGGIAAETLSQRSSFESAKELLDVALSGQYVDVHYSVFSPKSFLLLLYNMINARLFPFRCVEFYPTERNGCTFGVLLQACPQMRSEPKVMAYEMHKLIRVLDSRKLLGE